MAGAGVILCKCGGGDHSCGSPTCPTFKRVCTGGYYAVVDVSGGTSVSQSDIVVASNPALTSTYNSTLHDGDAGSPTTYTVPSPHGLWYSEGVSMSIPSDVPCPANPWGGNGAGRFTSYGRFKSYDYDVLSYTFDALTQNGITVEINEEHDYSTAYYQYSYYDPYPTEVDAWRHEVRDPDSVIDQGSTTTITTSHIYDIATSIAHAWTIAGQKSFDKLLLTTRPYNVPAYTDGVYTGSNDFIPLTGAVVIGGAGGGAASDTSVCEDGTFTGSYSNYFGFTDDGDPISTGSGGTFSASFRAEAAQPARDAPRKLRVTGTVFCHINPYTGQPVGFDGFHTSHDGWPDEIAESDGEPLPLLIRPAALELTLRMPTVGECGVYNFGWIGSGTVSAGGTPLEVTATLDKIGPSLWRLSFGDVVYSDDDCIYYTGTVEGVEVIEQTAMPLHADTVPHVLWTPANPTEAANYGSGFAYYTKSYRLATGAESPQRIAGVSDLLTSHSITVSGILCEPGDPTYYCDSGDCGACPPCEGEDYRRKLLTVSGGDAGTRQYVLNRVSTDPCTYLGLDGIRLDFSYSPGFYYLTSSDGTVFDDRYTRACLGGLNVNGGYEPDGDGELTVSVGDCAGLTCDVCLPCLDPDGTKAVLWYKESSTTLVYTASNTSTSPCEYDDGGDSPISWQASDGVHPDRWVIPLVDEDDEAEPTYLYARDCNGGNYIEGAYYPIDGGPGFVVVG